jgi:hypothetical protein
MVAITDHSPRAIAVACNANDKANDARRDTPGQRCSQIHGGSSAAQNSAPQVERKSVNIKPCDAQHQSAADDDDGEVLVRQSSAQSGEDQSGQHGGHPAEGSQQQHMTPRIARHDPLNRVARTSPHRQPRRRMQRGALSGGHGDRPVSCSS